MGQVSAGVGLAGNPILAGQAIRPGCGWNGILQSGNG